MKNKLKEYLKISKRQYKTNCHRILINGKISLKSRSMKQYARCVVNHEGSMPMNKKQIKKTLKWLSYNYIVKYYVIVKICFQRIRRDI